MPSPNPHPALVVAPRIVVVVAVVVVIAVVAGPASPRVWQNIFVCAVTCEIPAKMVPSLRKKPT